MYIYSQLHYFSFLPLTWIKNKFDMRADFQFNFLKMRLNMRRNKYRRTLNKYTRKYIFRKYIVL